MAINSIAARSAYGISETASKKQLESGPISINVQEGLKELSELTYSRKVVVKAQAPEAQAANSEAATATFSTATAAAAQQSPQKREEGRVRSLLAEKEDAETPPPSREAVEGLARRYLKVTGAAASGTATDAEVKKLADFYGANPGRAERFAALVNALDQGEERAPQAQESVAIA